MTGSSERPATEAPLTAYLARLARGEIAYQQTDDGRAVFFPRVAAPGSGESTLGWHVSKGFGVVYSVTTVRARGSDPYNVSLIDMDEGFRLMSRVEGLPPDQVRIGLRVRARIVRGNDEPPYPVFDPVVEGSQA
ncbi:OB-fold domain-containing protein [Bradyrhizobium brasilense]|uniref:Zn-ribbon domain-containing OB-fold protein n=1 Tax=Bradyrhizobium brasilense TaxID=1419277 RepID=UPI002877B2DF|nr:OB-fold domain-containing protein [Bradyrhizobium brasilense]MCP3419604.1 OB-fold domain-containing protein [Bradyrhizobium brasilense]